MFGLTPPGLLVRGRFPVNTRHFVEDCWPYVAQAAARESPPGARVPSRLSVPATVPSITRLSRFRLPRV